MELALIGPSTGSSTGYGYDWDKYATGFGVTPELSWPLLAMNIYGSLSLALHLEDTVYESCSLALHLEDIVLGKMLFLKCVIHLQGIIYKWSIHTHKSRGFLFLLSKNISKRTSHCPHRCTDLEPIHTLHSTSHRSGNTSSSRKNSSPVHTSIEPTIHGTKQWNRYNGEAGLDRVYLTWASSALLFEGKKESQFDWFLP